MKRYCVVCRKSEEGEILRYPEGKSISNGKIIPVVCIMRKTIHPQQQGLPFVITVEENLNLDTDCYGWKDRKIKIRKLSHIRKENGYNPLYYDVIQYAFYYLEDTQ